MQEFDVGALMRDEEITLNLKSLYRQYGYRPFRMNRFEEYDFYADNRRFLMSDSILTFTDLNGKLMALKPDVTLSIIKGVTAGDGAQKVYYSENVYRADATRGERSFREIMQVGLEWIGKVDLYGMSEVISLAARSLAMFSDRYALDISHMGLVTGLMDEMRLSEGETDELLKCLGSRNIPGICRLAGEKAEKLCALVGLYGTIPEVLPRLRALSVNEQTDRAIEELSNLYTVFEGGSFAERVHLDFSIVNDLRYYNGIIFRGFLDGVPRSVLSGGRYDSLMQRLGRNLGAIGFAVYLDAIESRLTEPPAFDADVLLLYGEDASARAVADAVAKLSAPGRSVRAQREPGNVRAKTVVQWKNGRLETVG